MQLILLNTIFIVLISVCYSDLNITQLSIVTCEKCSPCWNIFSKNYGPCSNEEFEMNPFNDVQPMCIDTLILLIIMFLGIVILIPTCLWLFSLWIKRCRNINAKYIVNGRIIT
ncbi:unnamed protein product [Rotaria sordida]|uniref:Uncharacterized protein n=1 Tax=Rotaria sordida TaxID=392033 RepID=A0A813R578_9BILA|nr:unnamed protein product [Rotaria sordida]CAF0861980.1 unnamed protein product [Rotaria sordida]CAF1527861.1 unnamed protein product [Rotaria sordida]CAF1664233.1 unnamed protein product [Rotaria sordida]CAF3618508.1 unnamed protein product [Rotaria sordida]